MTSTATAAPAARRLTKKAVATAIVQHDQARYRSATHTDAQLVAQFLRHLDLERMIGMATRRGIQL